MIPISDFDGFISLHMGLLSKLGLWSFSVMKEFLVAIVSILLSNPPMHQLQNRQFYKTKPIEKYWLSYYLVQ